MFDGTEMYIERLSSFPFAAVAPATEAASSFMRAAERQISPIRAPPGDASAEQVMIAPHAIDAVILLLSFPLQEEPLFATHACRYFLSCQVPQR
jgi:hypothetical protein